MTNKYQDALDCIKLTKVNFTDFGAFDLLQDFLPSEWIDTLQELIDKETPKKFKRIEPFVYECPTCEERYDLNEYDGNYCMICGQKIDWSDWL